MIDLLCSIVSLAEKGAPAIMPAFMGLIAYALVGIKAQQKEIRDELTTGLAKIEKNLNEYKKDTDRKIEKVVDMANDNKYEIGKIKTILDIKNNVKEVI